MEKQRIPADFLIGTSSSAWQIEVKHTSGDTLAFIHDENNLLDCDALIIDEMSMVDSCLF